MYTVNIWFIIYKYISAVKRLIASKIKVFVCIIYVCSVYIYYVYKYTHACIYFENIYMYLHVYIYIHLFIL